MIACKDCRCWVPEKPGDTSGDCRALPPVVLVVGPDIATAWPATPPDCGCDQGNERESP